ncbi:MAG: signal peptidase I [Firmicutes bacterium]|nr:signal peptidase I [Bacillota bacterium]
MLKKGEHMKKVFKWLSNIILGILIILVLFSVFSMFQSRKNPDKVQSIFGYKPMSVLTGSMRPKLQPGDMIVAKDILPKEVKLKDIITFKIGSNTLVTHRVVDIVTKDNKLYFKTKGDANNVKDQDLVSSDQLIGVLAFNIPKGGYIANFIRSPKGFLLLIIVPIILLLGGELKSILSDVDECDNKVKKF